MNGGRIRILHILWAGRSGGAEKYLRDITIYADRSRFEHVVCFLSRGGWVADEIARNGVEVHVLGMKNGMDVRGAFRFFLQLMASSADIVHNHSFNYLINIILLLFSHVPRLYFEHGGSFLSPDPRKVIIFYYFFGNHHDLILVNSKNVQQRVFRLTKINPSKVQVMYIGVDVNHYQGLQNKSLKGILGIPLKNKIVGLVGRLVPVKGIDDFIRIAAVISVKLKNECTFLVVGEGPMRSCLEALAKQLGVDVRFLGDRADVPDLLSLFDVFVFTSRWESFGIVLLEAMASRVPVVGFPTDGAREIMELGGALIVEERNITEAATAVMDVLENSDKAKALAVAGHANVSTNFNINVSVAALEEIYVSLLSSRS